MSLRKDKDKRPWLIISRSEAIALQEAAMHSRFPRGRPSDLERAIRVLDKQLKWIDDPLEDDGEPTIYDALRREKLAQ